MKRLLILAAGMGVAAALAAPVLACGDGWMGQNLVATPGVKAALRATFLRAHPEYSSARVGADGRRWSTSRRCVCSANSARET